MASVFNITHNEDKTMALILRYTGTLTPVDLTNATEIVVKLPITGGQYMQKKLSVSGQVIIDPASPKLGRILIPLVAADSVQLNPAAAQDVEVDVTGLIGSGKVTPVKFSKILNVSKMIDEA